MLHGRMGRPLYALGIALSAIAAFISYLFAIAVSIASGSIEPGIIVLVISGALIAIVQLPLHVKRLHDVDLSGWWLLVPAALTGVLLVTARTMAGPDGLNVFAAECWVVPIPYALACAAGFAWPGHRGSNRYGPQRVGHSTLVNVASTIGAAGLLLLLAVVTVTFFTS